MLQAFVITLREGLEAFLIVAISLVYLRKTGRLGLRKAVYWGVVVSIALSVVAGLLLQRAANQALWEGVLALVAAVLVGTLIVHMWRIGPRLKAEIQTRLDTESARPGPAALLGVFGFTVLMITREGMEAALLFNALLTQVRSNSLLLGATVGVLAAAMVAWAWSRWGHRIDLGLFFQVTAIFLMVFVVQLLLYGFHELTESGLLPNSEALHWATEPFGPDGVYGQLLTYLLVLLPGAWLVGALIRRRRDAAGVPSLASDG